MDYQHILVPTDLKQASERVLNKALALADTDHNRLRLLHVVEYPPLDSGDEVTLSTGMELIEGLVEQRQQQLQEMARRCGCGDARRQVVVGNIKSEILREARDNPTDLIVIGKHERHGLAILVNRTEDTLMHEATCDIFAVHLD